VSRPTISRRFSDTLLSAVLVMAVVVALAIGVMCDARGELIGEYDLTQGETLSPQNLVPLIVPERLGDLTFELPIPPGNATFTFNGTGSRWGNATNTPGAGVSVAVPSNFGNYTIGLRFSFGAMSSGLYQRLLRFDDIDNGMYVFGNGSGTGTFRFYDGAEFPSGGDLMNNTPVDFVMTRDGGSGQVYGYTIAYSPNPVVTPVLNFVDDDDELVSTGGVLEFFRDQTGGIEFSPSGSASLIKLWDVPLTAGEITYSMVPEPATVALLAAAGGGAMLYLRHRRRRLR
jgi:hypothetical protein